jgi:hypothetical protein
MRSALSLTVLLLASSVAAGAQTPVTLDQVFADYCAAQASANPACGSDSPSTPAYKWLLLDDVCAHGDNRAYCSRFASISHATEPCVVAYSHRHGRWRPLHSLEASGKWAYATDVNGAPTIVVSRTGECTAIVEDTKPLTYDAELGAVEEKSNDLFAGLKDLAALLGATLGAAAEKPLGARTPDRFDELARATSSLARSLVALGDLHSDVVVALNVGELSDTGELTPVDWRSAALDAAGWHGQFAGLRTLRQQAIDSLEGAAPSSGQQKILKQAQDVVDRREDIAKAVVALSATRDRWNQFVVGSRMLTWMVVNLRQQPVSWTKDQVHEFRVGVETPFASAVATRLPKVETSVRFTSPKASMFGIGAGLVITPIQQATYKAVAGADGVKRITATEHDSRTGQLGLFFDWRLIQAWHPAASTWVTRPALEGGVAIDTKTPGFFPRGIARDHEVDPRLRRPDLAERHGARWPAGARPGGQRRCDQAEGYVRRGQLRERQLRDRRPAAVHEVRACSRFQAPTNTT